MEPITEMPMKWAPLEAGYVFGNDEQWLASLHHGLE
jgi:hypothetical protein